MITGKYEVSDNQHHLVVTRELPAPVADVWAAITDSPLLGRWLLTWTGDPASGRVDARLEFEEGTPTEGYAIEVCEAPRHLRVRAGDADAPHVWVIDVQLRAQDGGTTLVLTQPLTRLEDACDLGPGWEYYLDRLAESLATAEVSTIAWPGRYPALAGEYASAFGLSHM